MHAPPTKPMWVRDLEQPLPTDPPPHGPPHRRALRPAIVATAAVVAVGLASTVGTLAFGHGTSRPVAAGAAAAGSPAGSTDAVTARGTQAGISAAERSSARPVSAAPTGTGAVGMPAPPSPGVAAAQAARAAQATGDATVETAVLTLVNQERGKAGCGPLTADSRLATAARLHSEDMAARGFFDHTTPDGVTFDQRITKAGYRWSGAAENIAKGQTTPASVMDSWMHSPGHRANILNCGFKNIGIGLGHQGSTPLWTQDFGSPLA